MVSPYRPFAPESVEHQRLGAFDWVDALRMLATSVHQSCGCPTYALTDVDTELGVPAYQFQTKERRLMVWMLEVALCYLESDRFDEDTVMVCPDTLVFDDLSSYFTADLGIVVRPSAKYAARPIINSVQWWAVSARRRLVLFYRQALAIAKSLPEKLLIWGADSEPIRQLLHPITIGPALRAGVDVNMIYMPHIMSSLPQTVMDDLDAHRPVGRPAVPIADFRYTRKHYMRRYFEAVCVVPA